MKNKKSKTSPEEIVENSTQEIQNSKNSNKKEKSSVGEIIVMAITFSLIGLFALVMLGLFVFMLALGFSSLSSPKPAQQTSTSRYIPPEDDYSNKLEYRQEIDFSDLVDSEYESPYSYCDKNGTVVSFKTGTAGNVLIRKVELNGVKISTIDDYNLYDDFVSLNKVGRFQRYCNVNIKLYCLISYKNSHDNYLYENWFYCESEKYTGWFLYKRTNYYLDFYKNGDYSFVEYLETPDKTYTIRNLKSKLYTYGDYNIYETPGFSSNVLYEQTGDEYKEIDVYCITEETDILDGNKDYWLKIKFDKNKFGWIFGNCIDSDCYGPKYEIPDDFIIACLNHD